MAKKTSKPKGIKPEMLAKVNDQRREITEIIISTMEAAAQAFYRMSLAGMWDRLTENLEDATIYGN